jgi:hypothetical protein
VVVVESAQHPVNLGLAVASAGLEGLRDAVEQQQPLSLARLTGIWASLPLRMKA